MDPLNRGTLNLLVLLTPHFNMSATAGFLDPFRAANYLEGRGLVRWQIVSEKGGACPASNGMVIDTRPLAELRGPLRFGEVKAIRR